MSLRCVPFYAEMCQLDLKAIYRRRKEDNFGQPILDADGREQWDLTGPLPMRRHQDYHRKRFEYVTLADEQSLVDCAKILVQHGHHPADYANQDRRTRSPFNLQLYMEDARSNREHELTALRQAIAQFGADVVVAIRRTTDPHFELPPEIRAEIQAQLDENAAAAVADANRPLTGLRPTQQPAPRKKPGPKPKEKTTEPAGVPA